MRTNSGTVARRALFVAALVAVMCTAAMQLASTTEVRASCIVNPYCDHSHTVHCPGGATFLNECVAQFNCRYDCSQNPPPPECDGCGE